MNRLIVSWQAGVVVISTALLSACNTFGGSDVEIACPPTQIAVPSDRIGHSDDDGRIRYVATIEQLLSSCEVGDDHVVVNLAFNLKAERGPVFEDQPVALTYYIATVDPNREIVDKRLLNVELALKPDQAESIVRETLTLHLPVSNDATGANYSLYLGFQPDLKS